MQLTQLVSQNRAGKAIGLPSFCTSNDFVIDSVLDYAASHNLPVLIEATCNQVNQFGGYTGMQPKDFANKIRTKAQQRGITADKLILGGDHLGPNPWKHLPATQAMDNAKQLVKLFVEAGFTKTHLDASMACGDEPTPSFELVAERSAQLCQIAEQYAPDPEAVHYIIGTEVPVPGGESDDMSGIQITTPQRFFDTIDTHKVAFEKANVSQGFERTIGVVVQPGVDFSHEGIFHFDADAASALTASLNDVDKLCFEAHSTDYQTTENLAALVENHSAILKVGPEVTFRFREAVLALDAIENILKPNKPAKVIEKILTIMDENPSDWQNYYQGTPDEIAFLKLYSLSDRIRYYWDHTQVSASLQALIENLEQTGIKSALSMHYFDTPIGDEYYNTPKALIDWRIKRSIARYYQACGWSSQ